MKESKIELILQRAREKFPLAAPRIISDNGPQFIAKEFKKFIRDCGMIHVRTSPYYPLSNGKIECWHREYKETVVRPRQPQSAEETREMTAEWIGYYNNVRLHSALYYIAPIDQLEGHAAAIFVDRDEKLEAARVKRRSGRQRTASQESKGVAAAEVENQSRPRYNETVLSEDRDLELGLTF